MRKAFVIASILALTLASAIQAAAPQLINYQGRLTDAAGEPVPDGSYSVFFTIYNAAVAGTPVWDETQIVTSTDGLFAVLLGSVNPVFDSVFNGTTRYLGIAVAGDPELSPRVALVSVPYAHRVNTVDGASGGNITSKVSIGPDHILTGDSAAIGGGAFNTASGILSTVGGGKLNIASGDNSTISGGNQNFASGTEATIGGGLVNGAHFNAATVGGGRVNTAFGISSTVSGGNSNMATATDATVGGGFGNIANNNGATISGGRLNTASGIVSFIGGGRRNKARGNYSVVAGGGGSTLADSNLALGFWSVIGGGSRNTASNVHATVVGGLSNTASGSFSFAAGRQAKANHDGSFVWADQAGIDFASSAVNQFNVRASGGTRIFSNSALTTGVTLAAGGGAWSAVSDSAVKENIRPVDGSEILEKLSQLDVSRWNYITQDESIEHIGPMAQDFYRLFGLGEDDKHINTLDPDGVALAAIKALYEKNNVLEQNNKELNDRLSKLEELIEKLSEK